MTGERLLGRLRGWTAVFSLAMWALPASALAQQAQPAADVARRGMLSVSSGIFWPSAQPFRDLYGSVQPPLTVQFDWRIQRRLTVFGGARWIWAHGKTVSVEASTPDERFPITLGIRSLRAGARVSAPAGALDLSFGAGATVNTYQEDWPAAGLTGKGTRAGFLVQAAAARELGRRLSVVARVEYGWVSGVPSQGPETVTKVNLGGLDVTVGLGIRF
jgi:hypothetical protein